MLLLLVEYVGKHASLWPFCIGPYKVRGSNTFALTFVTRRIQNNFVVNQRYQISSKKHKWTRTSNRTTKR